MQQDITFMQIYYLVGAVQQRCDPTNTFGHWTDVEIESR